MALNLSTIKLINKQGSTTNSEAIVSNGYFTTVKKCEAVQIEVNMSTGGKFKKTAITTKVPGQKKLLNYCNLLFEDVILLNKKITKDTYGKLKLSINIPSDSTSGLQLLQQHLYNQAVKQVELVGEQLEDMRRILYTNQDGDQSWVYVEVDLNDKFYTPTLNGEELTVEKFNETCANAESGTVVLKVSPVVWQLESGAYDMSLKFKLLYVKTD